MEYKIFKSGEPVTAEFMTDLVKEVVDAENNAAEAKTKSEQADENAQAAKTNSEQVLAKVDGAYDKAVEVERKAINGEFNGKSIFVKYNTSPTDVGASVTWQEGMNYIGFAISSDAVAPSTGYSWAKFTGPAGATGPQGPAGITPDLTNYVDTGSQQTIAAAKTFSSQITFANGAKMGKWTISTNSSNELVFTYVG